jgi:hypothetical protein
MKAKKKKVESIKPEDLGLDFVSLQLCEIIIAELSISGRHPEWRFSAFRSHQSVSEEARFVRTADSIWHDILIEI